MHPRQSGQGFVPRYGGGWMHQFGHVYALQQELLSPDKHNWFRAMELWHLARHEGIAMNAAHYRNILRQCVPAAAWSASLEVLRQMRQEAIRPDVEGVACAMAACADAVQPEATEAIFKHYSKMQLDSQCYLALIKVHQRARNDAAAIKAGRAQDEAHVPMVPATYAALLESAAALDDVDLIFEYVRRVSDDCYVIPKQQQKSLQMVADRHQRGPEFRQLVEFAKDEPLQLVDVGG